jgi:hypothetical protein
MVILLVKPPSGECSADLGKPKNARPFPCITSLEDIEEQVKEFILLESTALGWSTESNFNDLLAEVNAQLKLGNKTMDYVFYYTAADSPNADGFIQAIKKKLPFMMVYLAKKSDGSSFVKDGMTVVEFKAFLKFTIGGIEIRRQVLAEESYQTKLKEKEMGHQMSGNTINMSGNASCVVGDENKILSPMGEYAPDTARLQQVVQQLSAAIDQLGTEEALEISRELAAFLPIKRSPDAALRNLG